MLHVDCGQIDGGRSDFRSLRLQSMIWEEVENSEFYYFILRIAYGGTHG